MLLRRSWPLAVVLIAACAQSRPAGQGSTAVVFTYAMFDLANGNIPLPNDLMLQQGPDSLSVTGANRELISSFIAAGGFPNDQEAPITIDFQGQEAQPDGTSLGVAPSLNLATFTPSTVALLSLDPHTGAIAVEEFDPPVAADYRKLADHATLTLHHKGRTRWTAGRVIIVAIRSGANGVKTADGAALFTTPTMSLLEDSKDLSLPENQGLITFQLGGDRVAAAEAGATLERLRKAYLLPLRAIESVKFPAKEVGVIATFAVAPAPAAHVETDAGAGLMPLPSDFLLGADGVHVANIPAFGPLASGLALLDGFSTTAMILAQTSTPIIASTVTQDTVFLYELGPSGAQLVDPSTYETQPSQVTQSAVGGACAASPSAPCLSTVIALQPASANLPTTVPLKERTEYAVIITDSVKGLNLAPLRRSTLGNMLFFQSRLYGNGHSLVSGATDGQARGLEQMRRGVQVAAAQVLADKGIAASHIAMAYTFRTQSITGVAALTDPTQPVGALQLGALPYRKNADGSDAFPSKPVGTPQVLSPRDAFTRYGIDPETVPSDHLQEVLETQFVTFNILDPLTGAFRPDAAKCTTDCAEMVRALVAVPKVPTSAACAGDVARCTVAPLVVFRHGVFKSRGTMLLLADRLAQQGMVTVAIDAVKHGDRSFCSRNEECATGTCTSLGLPGTQGDSKPPGSCCAANPAHAACQSGGTGLLYQPILCAAGKCPSFDSSKAGLAVASGDFLVSGNLFRTRDSLRQDVIDQSMLVRVMAPPAAIAGHSLQAELASKGVLLNPGAIYYVGHSLGAMQGVLNVAANPRISKVVLNVGGGTVVDTFANAPKLSSDIGALLATFTPPIALGTPEYLLFINTAKWILDPAEPLNFAKHLIASPLPNLLAGGAPQAPKAVLGQRAQCDDTVPDPFNLQLFSGIGLSPLIPPFEGPYPASTLQLFTNDPHVLAPTQCTPQAGLLTGAVQHGFLLRWGADASTPGLPPTPRSLTVKAQDDVAAFLGAGTLPPAVETP